MSFILFFAVFLHRPLAWSQDATCAISGEFEEKEINNEIFPLTLKFHNKRYVQTIKHNLTNTTQCFPRKHVRFFETSNNARIPKQIKETEAPHEGEHNDTILYEKHYQESDYIAKLTFLNSSKTSKIESADDVQSNDGHAGCTKLISKTIAIAYIILFKKTEKYADKKMVPFETHKNAKINKRRCFPTIHSYSNFSISPTSTMSSLFNLTKTHKRMIIYLAISIVLSLASTAKTFLNLATPPINENDCSILAGIYETIKSMMAQNIIAHILHFTLLLSSKCTHSFEQYKSFTNNNFNIYYPMLLFIRRTIMYVRKEKAPPPDITNLTHISENFNILGRKDMLPYYMYLLHTLFNIFISGKYHVCGHDSSTSNESEATASTNHNHTRHKNRGRRSKRINRDKDNDPPILPPTPPSPSSNQQEEQTQDAWITYRVSFTYEGEIYVDDNATKAMIYKSIIAEGYYVEDIEHIEEGMWKFTLRVLPRMKDLLIAIMERLNIQNIEVEEVLEPATEQTLEDFNNHLIEKNNMLALAFEVEALSLNREVLPVNTHNHEQRYIINNGSSFSFTMNAVVFRAMIVYTDELEIKASIYKAFNMKGYYIDDIECDTHSSQYIIRIMAAVDSTQQFMQFLKKAGIEPLAFEEITDEINDETLNIINDALNDRVNTLALEETKYTIMYTHTPRAIEEVHNMIMNDGNFERMCISLSVTDENEVIDSPEYTLARLVSTFPDIKGYIRDDYNDTTFNIVINTTYLESFLSRADELNISYTIEEIFTLDSETEELEITGILTNRAMKLSFTAKPFKKQNGSILHEFVFNFECEADEDIIARMCSELIADIHISNTSFNEENSTHTITCYANYNQLEKFASHYSDIAVHVLQGILVTEEVSSYLDTLIQRNKELVESFKTREEERIEAEFMAVPISEKREAVFNIFTNIINTEDIDTKQQLYSELLRYKGINLYEDAPETKCVLLEYIRDADSTFKADEDYAFMYSLESLHSTEYRMITCPMCQHASNREDDIIKHLKHYHKVQLKGIWDARFTLLTHMKERALIPLSESNDIQTCFKCTYCDLLHNNKSFVINHCRNEHPVDEINIITGYVGNKEQIMTILQSKADEDRRIKEEQAAAEERKQQEIEEEKKRRQEEREEARRREEMKIAEEHQRILNLTEEDRIEEVNAIFRHAVESNNIASKIEDMKELERYTGTIFTKNNEHNSLYLTVTNGHNGSIIRKNAVLEENEVINGYESFYADTIMRLANYDIDKYCFIEKNTKTMYESKLMIRCPYCTECCNDAEWMMIHMKKFHRESIQDTIGYTWAFILQSIDNARLSAKEYFGPIDGYRCSECGFTNTKENAVRAHCKKVHSSLDIPVHRGVIGRFIDAFFKCTKIYRKYSFKPLQKTKIDCYIYFLNRKYRCTASQTECIVPKVVIRENTVGLDGGSRLSLTTHSSQNVRGSALMGCYNPSCACYANALLQALFSITTLKSDIMSYNQESYNIVSVLKAIFTALDRKQNNRGTLYIDPRESGIYHILGYNEHQQTDPSEVLGNILYGIERDRKELYEKFTFTEFTHNMTDGMETIITNVLLQVNAGVDNSSEFRYAIEDLITASCSPPKEHIRKEWIIKSNIFVVALSRGENNEDPNDEDNILKTKMMYKVDVKEYLTLEYAKYRAMSIVVHIGDTSNKGHFITYAYRNGEYYKFNDTQVEKLNPNETDDEYMYRDEDTGNARVALIFYEKVEDITSQETDKYQSLNESADHSPDSLITESQHTPEKSCDQEYEDTYNILSECSVSDSEQSEIEIQTITNTDPNNNTQKESEENTPNEIHNNYSMEDAYGFYCMEMNKLAKIETTKEAESWAKEIKRSPFHGCLKDKVTEEEMLDMTISEVGILVTKIMPPFNAQHALCCYPGCTYSNIASERDVHWKEIHKDEEGPPQYDIVHTAFAVAGLFSRFIRVRQDNNETEEISNPALICPICETVCTTNQKAWTSHISNYHDELRHRIKILGRAWGIETYNFTNNKRTTIRSYIETKKMMGCPYCHFCANTTGQVNLHISTKHKEHQKERERVSIEVEYSSLCSPDKASLYPHKEQEQPHIAPQDICNDNEGSDISQIYTTQEVVQQVDDEEDRNIIISEEEQEDESKEESTESSSQDEDISLDIEVNEFKNAIRWSRELRDHQASIPRLNLRSRGKLRAPISNFLKDTAIPLLKRFIRTKRGENDDERWMAIDGVISFIESEMTKVIINTLGIRGTRRSRKRNEEDDQNEIEFAQISRHRDAAAKSASLINSIIIEMNNQEDSVQVKENKIYALKDRCIFQLRQVDERVLEHVFQCRPEEITGKEIDELIEEGEDRVTAKLTYLSNAFDESLTACENKRKKYQASKVQELYSEDPRRAMRWYIDRDASPTCPIHIETVRSKLAERWQADHSYMPPEDENNLWKSPFKLSESEKEMMMKQMTDKDFFMSIINSRNSQSANGPDGIGYSILKLDEELAATLMVLISKAMLKFQRSPTLWNRARTILIYKKGDPNELDNWRPLSIASCLYRVWTAALASIIQMINTQRPLFHRSQKGFIKGVDGCLEHSQTTIELFNDANRNRKNLYTLTIDLKDAFGSIPHGYIAEMMKEIDIPKQIRGVIEDTYNKGTTVINLDKLDSTEIRINKGVKQGCPLSPLIFNFCMNPLLKELQDSGKGYKVGNRTIAAQAYADDIILFAETRRNMNILLEIVERFTAYSRLVINTHKCHSLSYIIGETGRITDTEPFMINHNEVPLDDLSHSIEYLGTAATASICVRYKGTEETIESVKNLASKVLNSQLKVNQKLDALRRFVIPCLDYTLTEGNPRRGDLEDIDRMMRVGIANHVGVPVLPIPFTAMHWKDGGLSLQPLKVRASVLKVKKFIALYNSPNSQTCALFRYFAESEREFRKVNKINKEANQISSFLDWETDEDGKVISGRSGTASITGTVNRECIRLGVKIILDEGRAKLIIPTKKGDIATDTPRLTSQILMKRNSEKARDILMQDGMHGHSLINLVNASDSNYLLGNYTNKLSDKIISFMIAARTNEMYTGYISHLNGKKTGPKCPHCSASGEKDTLFHRLNDCKSARAWHTYRHNLVATEIVKQARVSFPSASIRQGQTVRVHGMPDLITEEGRLKPDITIITPSEIKLIEISCPYDTPKDNGTTALDVTYTHKKEKYEELRRQCEAHFRRTCKTYVVIVSSLGAIHKDTIVDLRHLFRFRKKTKSLNYLSRRISTAAIIGSFLTFHKINIRRRNPNGELTAQAQNERVSAGITDITIGDVTREEQDLPESLLL